MTARRALAQRAFGIGIVLAAAGASAQVPVTQARIVTADGREGPITVRRLDILADTAFKVFDLGPRLEVARGTSRLNAWIEARDGGVLGKSSLTQDDFRDRLAQ